MTAPNEPSSPRSRPVVELLGAEWTRITLRARDLRIVRTWDLPGEAVRSLDDVLGRCGYRAAPARTTRTARTTSTASTASTAIVRGDDSTPDSTPDSNLDSTPASIPDSTLDSGHDETADDGAHDAYLLRLLIIARHDRLAARIVLQRILPSLSALARRHATGFSAQQDLLDDLVANSWASIRSYPVERRPRRVVPNLVRDIGFQTIVRPSRRRGSSELPTDHRSMLGTEYIVAVDPLQELVDLLNDARGGGMSQNDIDLICQIVSLDRSDRVAAARAVTPRTVRNHRDAIVHRLRDFVATAA